MELLNFLHRQKESIRATTVFLKLNVLEFFLFVIMYI